MSLLPNSPYSASKASADLMVRAYNETFGHRKSEDLITYVKDRPGHDVRYAIDNTKITSQLGWEPSYTFEQGIKETIQWYLDNPQWIENIVSGDYVGYYEEMYKGR